MLNLTLDTGHLIYDKWKETHGWKWQFSKNVRYLDRMVWEGLLFEDIAKKDHFLTEVISKLMFILPCKSDWQPIFLKKQGIYKCYAKLWLLRPLIKNIPNSSHQYCSNVTFGASLAFQIREEYVFEDFFFFKLDLKGGK